MSLVENVTVTEFKAKCLELFDRLNRPGLDLINVTKRGRIVAVVRAPAPSRPDVAALVGYQSGTVAFPDDFDWTAPVLDEPWVDDVK